MDNQLKNIEELSYFISATKLNYKDIEIKILNFLENNLINNSFENNRTVILTILKDFDIHHKNKLARIINEINDISQRKLSIQDLIDINSCIGSWLEEKNILYLLNKIKLRLANYYFLNNQNKESLNLIEKLIKSAKEDDDKLLLVESYLYECKNYFVIKNYLKAKNSLIACKSNAHLIYCPPNLQAKIDLTAGSIYCHEKDFKTGYSYFYEAFDIFNQVQNKELAQKCFNYMILCKTMLNKEQELLSLLTGRYGVKYSGEKESQLIIDISKANFSNKLTEFTKIISQNQEKISSDLIISSHINNLYENLFENNIFDLIQSYSKIQIDYLSQKLGVNYIECQNKLAELIIDKKLNGTLDQGNGQLIIFEDVEEDLNYENYNQTLDNMDKIVDLLFEKSKILKVN